LLGSDAGVASRSVDDDERRCPSCGALVSADAEWCGQCFASLREPTHAPPAPTPSAPAVPEVPTPRPPGEAATSPVLDEAVWPCSVCGARNPIQLEVCTTCGTPFAAVMRGAGRKVDPAAARARSMLLPGAGHTMLGYSLDGFARSALFVIALALAILLLVATPRSGPALLAIVLTMGLAIAVYALSLVEIPELAARGRLLVPSKILLWVGVGVMFVVVGMIALSVATSARR
jgi:ribosomal protein L40E